MSSDLGMLGFECDAPPYAIVRACRKLGLWAPEDVRWARRSRFHKQHAGWVRYLTTWTHLLGKEQGRDTSCTCGQPLPLLESYSFTYQSGEQVDYEIGQCPRCRSIYWEKV